MNGSDLSICGFRIQKSIVDLIPIKLSSCGRCFKSRLKKVKALSRHVHLTLGSKKPYSPKSQLQSKESKSDFFKTGTPAAPLHQYAQQPSKTHHYSYSWEILLSILRRLEDAFCSFSSQSSFKVRIISNPHTIYQKLKWLRAFTPCRQGHVF